MKTILVPIFVIGIAQSVFSQVEKGSFLVGGSMGFSSSKTKGTYSTNPQSYDFKTLSFSSSPNASYFIVKGLALGVTPSYSYSKQSQTSTPDTKSHSLSIGPLARYYFTFERWAVFAHANYNLSWQTTWVNYYDIDFQTFQNIKLKNKFTSLKAGVGVTYFPNSNVGIEGLIFYQQNNLDYDKAYYISSSNTPSINFNIGLQFYLSKKSVN